MKILFMLLLAYSLFAGTYDDNYKAVESNTTKLSNPDIFMYGDFKEIIRFPMISFESGELNDENRSYCDDILHKINDYKTKNEKFLVKIIGHTNEATDDYNEKVIDSDTYANSIQNWFRYSLDSNKSKSLSREYATEIKDIFVSGGVDENSIVLEYRAGKDMAYTDATNEGRDLSNRVMVSIYVLTPEDIDSDKDGVLDKSDKCPGTPRGASVDVFGCPIDSDRDGVIDYKDKCPNTPFNVKVDNNGCPFDSDKDGILDYKDKCPNTPFGVTVDTLGCPISQVLELNFQSSSDKILQKSHEKVVEFARFLKDNPIYKVEIIGHTDSTGKAKSNMILSQKRAKATKAALVSEGVDASRIVTKGRGELDPIKSNRTKEGRALNRRIEIKLSYIKK